MKILFHLGHPAHFHLFKNAISILRDNGSDIIIVIKKKDVLEDLLDNYGLKYINMLPTGRRDGTIGLSIGLLKQDIKLFKICKEQNPDLLVGTSVSISHVGFLLRIPSLNFNEDDAKAVPMYSYLAYPTATKIISPESCDNSIWKNKSIYYKGYHELAYLHPKYFEPNKTIVEKYINSKKPYFILRFAQLTAHHDKGIKGITSTIATELIGILKQFGNIYISSERKLESDFDKYRLDINPLDMHHILAYADMYIGDSQTMAAEAAVLGTPSIRFNDFVGRLGYLNELENKYGLTYGFKSDESDKLYIKIKELLGNNNIKDVWNKRKNRMLQESEDITAVIVNTIKKYTNK